VPEVFLNTLARFAVPLFIALAGFYLSLNPRNLRPLRFYRRTLPGLLAPYALYTLVYVLVGSRGSLAALGSLPGHLVHGSASLHLWFIPVIVELYLLHPFLRRWYAGLARPGAALAAAVVVQAAYVVAYELVVRPGGVLPLWADVLVTCTSCLKFIGFFVAGYHLHDRADEMMAAARGPRALRLAGAVWLAAGSVVPALWAWQVLAAAPETWSRLSHVALDLLTMPLAAAAFVMLIAWPPECQGRGLLRRLVGSCGLYAYGIYYLHPLVLLYAGRGLARYAGPVTTVAPLRSIVLFVLVAVLSVGAVKALARLPLGRLASG
jgi:surface polysaccharide O-acyltransferase-like enzyme